MEDGFTRVEFLLAKILEELRTHHAYIRDMHAQLDEKDERDQKRKLELDQVMLQSVELQKQGLAMVQTSGLMMAIPKPPEGKAS